MLNRATRKSQSGVMLLEALIAILVFSLGVLGVVGMQGAAIGASSDAKYRTDAGLLASELVARMWGGERRGSALETDFEGTGATGGTGYLAWKADVDATFGALAASPEVSVTPGAISSGLNPGTRVLAPHAVTVIVRWKLPNETATHSYQVQTLVTQTE